MTSITFAEQEGFESHGVRRKRLGQYFSGIPVSKLLVALASRPGMRSIADPMAGKGDMLVASKSIIKKSMRLDGVEIDPLPYKECLEKLKSFEGTFSDCILGSAFDWSILSKLDCTGYDLLTTNPPYVRYQSQKGGAGDSVRLPSALEVRNGLRNCLSNLKTLDEYDRVAFLALAEHYSGLSDLAVPSWILCAALVKPGGTLAMVVPEAWLNREYAAVVQYLLLRWFRIEFIVEDAHASWFTDAQVKTTLLVAKRIPRKTSVNDWSEEQYIRIFLPSTSASADSLVGSTSFAKFKHPEVAFAKKARLILQSKADQLCDEIAWQRIRIADHLPTIQSTASQDTWYLSLEESATKGAKLKAAVPARLASVLPKSTTFSTLADLGVCVGQGLRTGANDFFYVEVISNENRTKSVKLSKLFKGESINAPSNCILPVVRKQTDIPKDTYAIEAEQLCGGVLALQNSALPEHSNGSYSVLTLELSKHIRRAELTNVGDQGKLLPELSAVVTNVRKSKTSTGAGQRYWYMLPDFAPRHKPDLFIARVNSARPRAILNVHRAALIDANFATLWFKETDDTSSNMLLAYLNSTFAWTLLEFIGATMGGGALKLEATHLASFPVPNFTQMAKVQLAKLGTNLCKNNNNDTVAITASIDQLVCREVFGAKNWTLGLSTLNTMAQAKLDARRFRV